MSPALQAASLPSEPPGTYWLFFLRCDSNYMCYFLSLEYLTDDQDIFFKTHSFHESLKLSQSSHSSSSSSSVQGLVQV